MSEAPDTRGPITAAQLFAYCAQLNDMNFSRVMGWHWVVVSRDMPDGTRQQVLDRRDRLEDGPPGQSGLGGMGRTDRMSEATDA